MAHVGDGHCAWPEAKPEGQYCGTRRNKYVQQSQCGPLDRPVGEHQAPQLIDEILHALAKLSLACRGDKTIATSALAVFVRCAQLGPCRPVRSEEHTSELQSLMRISYAVFCLKKKTHPISTNNTHKSILKCN